jgi:hypothetical protein
VSVALTSIRTISGGGLALCVALLAASPASAQSAADKETARSLMDEGDGHFEGRRFDRALQAYRSAHEIMNVPTTGVEVARAQVALGLLVEARDTALAITRLSVTEREPAVFGKARAQAAELAEQLAARIPTVQVQLEGLPEDVPTTLVVDGVVLKGEARAAGRKLNPGRHEITVRAEGYRPTTTTIKLAEAESRTVKLRLQPDPSFVSTADASAGAATSEPTDDGAATASESASSSSSPWVYLGYGIGAVGLGVGSVAGILSIGKTNSIKDECDKVGECPDSASPDHSSAQTLATVSNVGFGVALVGAAVGTIALLTGPSSGSGATAAQTWSARRSRPSASVVPLVGIGSVGVRGTF